MKQFNSSMFDSIKGALASQESKSNFSDILTMKPGNTYTVRLLPNVETPSDTFYRYFNVGWESFATGQYVQYVSPTTFEERDPILENRFKIYKHGSESDKAKVTKVKRGEKWLINAYIVDDPTDADNNGKVKMLRYGKQVDKIIREAIDGEDSVEFGGRIFDLSPDGCNFKIKVEKQGEYPTYVSSRFTTADGDLKLSDDQIEKIYGGGFDLSSVFQIKSFEDLEAMWTEHFLVSGSNNTEDKPDQPASPGQSDTPNASIVDSAIANSQVADAAPPEQPEDEELPPEVAKLLASLNDD